MNAVYRPVDKARRGTFQLLQALDDAIAYRQSRVAAPCTDCGPAPGQRCDDHACDLRLISGYRLVAQATAAVLDRTRGARELMSGDDMDGTGP